MFKKKAADELAEHYFDTYGNQILRLAYSYLRNMTDAEDILQETLLALLKKQRRFESAEHEKAYILKVAANLCKNVLRRNKVLPTDQVEQLISKEAAQDNTPDDPSDVWEAVKKLPVSQSEVVHLYYAEGYKTAEIARILDRNESTVRSDLRRARQTLKSILEEDEFFE